MADTSQKETAPARFKLALNQYSLHRKIGGGGPYVKRFARRLRYCIREHPVGFLQPSLNPMDFPAFARETFDVGAVEYLSRFYPGLADDQSLLADLKTRADAAEVESTLIIIEREGDLGAADLTVRQHALTRHKKWADAAAYLGSSRIGITLETDPDGSETDQRNRLADGISAFVQYCATLDMDVAIENTDGLSADANWLSLLVQQIDHSRCGTLPDFGNFKISEDRNYDYLQGVNELLPYAKGVSMKTFGFHEDGLETSLDFPALVKSIVTSGFSGYLGIEFEGRGLDEIAGIRATKRLIEQLAGDYI